MKYEEDSETPLYIRAFGELASKGVDPNVARTAALHIKTLMECGKDISKQIKAKQHKVPSQRPVKCNVCGKISSNIGNLRIHIARMHTDDESPE
jgi:transcriptional regulatory protein LevR